MITVIGDVGYDVTTSEGITQKTVGGSGYHTLVGVLSVGGVKPLFLSCVGYDFNPNLVSDLGISTDHLSIKKYSETAVFYIKYENGIRELSMKQGASKYDCCELIDGSVIKSKYIYLAATDPVKQLKYINQLRKMGYTGKIAADVFDGFCKSKKNETLCMLDQCNIIFMNRDEREILKYRPIKKDVMYIFKQDKDGAECYYAGKHVIKKSYSERMPVIDVTGAGDVLAGAFLSLLDSGIDYENALGMAVFLASKSVCAFGTTHILNNIPMELLFTA